MHKNKVVVTGMGIISAIGKNVEENFSALNSNRSGLKNLSLFPSIHHGKLKVGQIEMSNQQLIESLKLPSENNFTRTALLGLYAAQQAVDNAGIASISEHKTGLISSTTVGGMDFIEKFCTDFHQNVNARKYISTQEAGDSTTKIADHIGIQDFTTTISTACSSAANAMILGAKMIESGKLDRVIVGGTDALAKFTINGFNSLMILSQNLNAPFDQNRQGLNLGEAAAYLVLEREDLAIKQNKKIWSFLSGYGNANDAYHQTASSENGEGAFLAMKKALEKANLSAKAIDYINAHGTATPNNDLSEGKALQRIFKKMPVFSSTKPFTGHTLAAAGAVEAIFSNLALEHQLVFANLNFKQPMEELSIIPQTKLIEKPLHHVMSNSFGFGGNCTSLIFTKQQA